MKSILQSKKECFKCGAICDLHEHHIYGGPNRKISEKNGFKVRLCGHHHNLSDAGVHFDKVFDLELKQLCQTEYEKTNTRQNFINLIGRNYL